MVDVAINFSIGEEPFEMRVLERIVVRKRDLTDVVVVDERFLG